MIHSPRRSPAKEEASAPKTTIVAPIGLRGSKMKNKVIAATTAMTYSLSLCSLILAHNQTGRNKV